MRSGNWHKKKTKQTSKNKNKNQNKNKNRNTLTPTATQTETETTMRYLPLGKRRWDWIRAVKGYSNSKKVNKSSGKQKNKKNETKTKKKTATALNSLELMFTYLTQMGIAPALMIHSDLWSWTLQAVSSMFKKRFSTGIGWNVAMRHLHLLTKSVVALGVSSWLLVSVRSVLGKKTVLECGGAGKMKNLANSFLLYWQIKHTRRIWAE